MLLKGFQRTSRSFESLDWRRNYYDPEMMLMKEVNLIARVNIAMLFSGHFIAHGTVASKITRFIHHLKNTYWVFSVSP